MVVLYGLSKDDLHSKCDTLAEYVGLGQFKDRMANDLSGGMKQKLALAVALLNTPKLLILDEPSTGVDPLSRRELWTLIKKKQPRRYHRGSRYAFHGRSRLLHADCFF